MKRGEIWIYSEISPWGFTAQLFSEKLQDLKDQGFGAFTIYINSSGGDVFDALAIYNEIRALKDTKIVINGLAASAASLIAMASDDVRMTNNSRMLIHNPWNWGAGDADYFQRLSDQLDDVKGLIVSAYKEKTGQSEADIKQWMDDEAWMNPDQAKERGFVERVIRPEEIRDFVARIFNAFKPKPQQREEGTDMGFKSMMIALFGLSFNGENPSDDEVLNAITKARNASGEKVADLETQLGALNTENQELKDQLQGFQDKEAEQREQEIETILDEAVNDGKISQDDRTVYQGQLEANFDVTQAILDAKKPSGLGKPVEQPTGKDDTKPTKSRTRRLKDAIAQSNPA